MSLSSDYMQPTMMRMRMMIVQAMRGTPRRMKTMDIHAKATMKPPSKGRMAAKIQQGVHL